MSKNNMPNNWSQVKKRWREKNPPDADGNYICWLCKQPVHESKMTLDHVATLELYPEYAKDLSNLRPSHNFCNEQRGQPKHSQLIHRFGRTRKRRR